jgi:hypothetical protein
MNKNLIQALNTYTSTLEQRIAALEARIAQLELQVVGYAQVKLEAQAQIATLKEEIANLTAANTQTNEEAQAQIATLKEEMANLIAAKTTTMLANEEPEVEIELIVDENQEEPVDMSDWANILEMDSPEERELVVEEPIVEIPVMEEPVVEEPLIEEPLMDETVVEEPVVKEPLMEEPLVEEPVVEEPLIEEKVVEEKVVEEKALEVGLQTPTRVEVTPEVLPAARPIPTQTSLFGPSVDDIRQAITLGDRFLFQREIFAGNGELMQKTLDELNTFDSFEEAISYMSENFEWNQESTVTQLFENVLRRRFF